MRIPDLQVDINSRESLADGLKECLKNFCIQYGYGESVAVPIPIARAIVAELEKVEC